MSKAASMAAPVMTVQQSFDALCMTVRRRNTFVKDRVRYMNSLSSRIRVALADHEYHRLRAEGKDHVEACGLSVKWTKENKEVISELYKSLIAPLMNLTEDGVDKAIERNEAKNLWKDYPAEKAHIDKTMVHLRPAITTCTQEIASEEKRLKQIVKTLPIWNEWAVGIMGVGEVSFGNLLGEINAIPSSFDDPAKIRKRLGLAVFDGHCQGKKNGIRISGDDCKKQMCSPSAFTAARMLVDSILMKKAANGPYCQAYDIKKAEYVQEGEAFNAAGEEAYPDLPVVERLKKKVFVTRQTMDDRARRWLASYFVNHLYKAWMKTEGKRADWPDQYGFIKMKKAVA